MMTNVTDAPLNDGSSGDRPTAGSARVVRPDPAATAAAEAAVKTAAGAGEAIAPSAGEVIAPCAGQAIAPRAGDVIASDAGGRLDRRSRGLPARRRRSRSKAGPPPARTNGEGSPATAAPAGTAPVNIAPVNTAPAGTAPINTAPVNTAPAGVGSAADPPDTVSAARISPAQPAAPRDRRHRNDRRTRPGSRTDLDDRPRPENGGTGNAAGADGQWRELTGSGRSQVSQTAALRARDADQPTVDDLARAEREVVVQRRHWTPGS